MAPRRISLAKGRYIRHPLGGAFARCRGFEAPALLGEMLPSGQCDPIQTLCLAWLTSAGGS